MLLVLVVGDAVAMAWARPGVEAVVVEHVLVLVVEMARVTVLVVLLLLMLMVVLLLL